MEFSIGATITSALIGSVATIISSQVLKKYEVTKISKRIDEELNQASSTIESAYIPILQEAMDALANNKQSTASVVKVQMPIFENYLHVVSVSTSKNTSSNLKYLYSRLKKLNERIDFLDELTMSMYTKQFIDNQALTSNDFETMKDFTIQTYKQCYIMNWYINRYKCNTKSSLLDDITHNQSFKKDYSNLISNLNSNIAKTFKANVDSQ
ncbi:hypothetical protein [Vibrio parahaemolyticus]|uniref:hypothetical protein n=1 Tax=Vibrio parahaemolyticus TaxID=670 RepID=UPI00146EAC50|nr:hypothetical protein [Vibrio parahaemolyticus]MDF4554949.1 hypothetical protein [Vibrio parahaemolyticus]MDF5352762.1 hypothetical protein [Vibrio parahaemolyticus]MDF5368213.1 hypothetical protein [Vibrio parahaemolyticus]MDG2771195.1 hypothetical protein [Vibrio parahaemolyticus]MDG2826625.1 hypothetical protein [Vibrio parahaemolyticus]